MFKLAMPQPAAEAPVASLTFDGLKVGVSVTRAYKPKSQGTQTDAGESTVDAEACEPDTPAAPDSSGVDAKDVREGDPLVYCRQGAACTGAETCVVDCHGSIAGLNLSPHMECSCVDGLFACTVPPSLVDTTPPPACPADTSSPCDAQCRVCVVASDPSKASRCFCSVEGTCVCGG